ncbi:MAG: YaaR family protein [Planctomycetes bacterium]|nr:YaaR family protein [Planctomycetota bacterium]
MIEPQGISSVSRRRLHEEKRKKREVSTQERVLFESCMDKVHDTSLKKDLGSLIKNLHREGERLVNNRSLAQLDHYKAKVREFIQKANRGTFKVKSTGFVDANGDYAAHVVVEKVDQSLETLTRLVLNKESPSFQILEQLDLIKGLLTDLLA